MCERGTDVAEECFPSWRPLDQQFGAIVMLPDDAAFELERLRQNSIRTGSLYSGIVCSALGMGWLLR
jgi:hypothetical protein